MTNKEKFLALTSEDQSNTLEKNKERKKNRAMLRESQKIAIKILKCLDDLKWSQRRLAKEMGVTPQQISKIVSGKENLTIETLIKLQTILNVPILASYYEDLTKENNTIIFEAEKTTLLTTKERRTPIYQYSSNIVKLFPLNPDEDFLYKETN